MISMLFSFIRSRIRMASERRDAVTLGRMPWLIACAGAVVIFSSGYELRKWRQPPPGSDHIVVREQAILAQVRRNPVFDFAVIGDGLTELAYLPSLCGGSVLNAGVSGARISDAKNLMAKLSPVLKAQTIVLAIGVNDAGTWASRSETIEENYEQLVRFAQSSGAEVFVATIGPVKTTMFAGANYDPSLIARINVQIKSVATRTGVTLIDLNTQLNADETTDGVHLDEEGSKRWHDLIESAVCHAPSLAGADRAEQSRHHNLRF
jgi:lysophospholipase L1-like esterase